MSLATCHLEDETSILEFEFPEICSVDNVAALDDEPCTESAEDKPSGSRCSVWDHLESIALVLDCSHNDYDCSGKRSVREGSFCTNL